MEALNEGPGTASELSAELDGLSSAICSVYLHRLWIRGWIERSKSTMRNARVGRECNIYGLAKDIAEPAPRRAKPPETRRYKGSCAFAHAAPSDDIRRAG